VSRRFAFALALGVLVAIAIAAGALLLLRHHGRPGNHDTSYWDAHMSAYLRFYARALARC